MRVLQECTYSTNSKTLTTRSLVTAIDVCLYVVEYLLGIQIKTSHALQEIQEENEMKS